MKEPMPQSPNGAAMETRDGAEKLAEEIFDRPDVAAVKIVRSRTDADSGGFIETVVMQKTKQRPPAGRGYD